MKKIYLIPLLLCLFLSVSSCKKSQEEPKTKVEKEVEKKVEKKLEDSRKVKSEDATLKIVAGSGNVFGIDLTNKIPIRGVQFTLEGAKMTDVRTTSRTTGFLASFNAESGIVILLSASGDKIAPGTGLIVEIICDKSSSASLSEIKIGK